MNVQHDDIVYTIVCVFKQSGINK